MDFLIIDTSSIIFGFLNKKDVFAAARRDYPSYNILISTGILTELSRIARNSGVKGSGAKTAIEALKFKKVNVDNNIGSVDSWIYERSREYPHSVVITNDTELYKRLKSVNIKCLKLTKAGLLR
jgi:rRNA-processing protein FCF1